MSCRCSRSSSRTRSTTTPSSTSRTRLRERGWLLPAYTFPANRTDLAALRVVVRRDFSHDLADMLLNDLRELLPRLAKQPEPVHGAEAASGFH